MDISAMTTEGALAQRIGATHLIDKICKAIPYSNYLRVSLSIYIYVCIYRVKNHETRTVEQQPRTGKGSESVCVYVSRTFTDISKTFCMWVLCETHVRHMNACKVWWSCEHLNQVRTAKKIRTYVSETSSIVPHGCSCMKIALGDDSIFQDELYDAIWPENCQKCLQTCWKM